MKELEYPFDSSFLIKKKKSLKRQLLENGKQFIEKRIAVLGGSTTHDIVLMMELFLLNLGIKPTFYESEYNKYYEDAVFDNPELTEFKPDIIYIHTGIRNLSYLPKINESKEEIDAGMEDEYGRFLEIWNAIDDKYHCLIIQNNFEYPLYRLLGNMDATDYHGRVGYVNRLNEKFAEYARDNKNFFILDINYLSAQFGLDAWSDPHYWYMYKYALSMDAVPILAYNVVNVIKSIYGKNKKAITLDLDNTLWGGVIGDDGVDNLEIGQETSMGQAYSEFQEYIKLQKDIGIILNICSKNDEENAYAGLKHPSSSLKPDDFVSIKANWEPKSNNLSDMAAELNLLLESFVFVDDNPAEREIVSSQLGVVSPDIGSVENYIKIIDHSGFFEVTSLSEDDVTRTNMYQANAKRQQLRKNISDYGEYLKSLDMEAEIETFEPLYYDRIAQLTNKSNQFNLTTKRFSRAEIEEAALDVNTVSLYGKLEDKFGDNGVVSVVLGRINKDVLDIELWLMSCRVLKRDMEYAMLDELVNEASRKKIKALKGYYYPTAKNKMVRDFYSLMGFEKISEDEDGNTVWILNICDYQNKNKYISLKK